MTTALRRYQTTGIALAGAGAVALTPIAVTPTAPSPPALASAVASAAEVSLTASTTFIDPITRWIQVFQAADTNISEILGYMRDRPDRSLPGLLDFLEAKAHGYGYALFGQLPQVVEGMDYWATHTLQPGLQMAFTLLASGQPAAATQALKSTFSSLLGLGSPFFGLMGFVTVPTMLMQDIVDLTRAVTIPLNLLGWVNPLLNLAWSPVLSLGITAQKLIDAVEAGDLLGALGAVLNAPAEAVDHFLNATGGLVEFSRTGSTGQFVAGGLLVELLIKIPRAIMANLAPPLPTAAVANASVATGTMVSLDAGSSATGADPEPAADDPAADTGQAQANVDTPTVVAPVEPEPVPDTTQIASGPSESPDYTSAPEADGTVDSDHADDEAASDETSDDGTGSESGPNLDDDSESAEKSDTPDSEKPSDTTDNGAEAGGSQGDSDGGDEN